MKILSRLLGLALIAFPVACQSVDSAPAGAPERSDIAQYDATGKTPSSAEGNAQAGQEWDELMRKLRDQHIVSEQTKLAQADEHYRLADRYYRAGEFAKAEIECQKAVGLNPNHGAAHALLLEIQFAMGKGQVTPQSFLFEKYLQEAAVRQQETLLEIDNALEQGKRAFQIGNYDDADRHFRRILEYAKWLPTGVELESRRKEASDLLERTKVARRQKDVEEQYVRHQMIEEERAREEIRKKIEQRKQLEILFGQAQLYFEREQYVRCIEICDKILYLDPRLASVEEMKLIAQRLSHASAERDNTRMYIEQWKRTFENVERMGILQAEDLSFPAREIWLELVSKRRPKGISDVDADRMSEQDREISEKLHTIQIDFDFQDATLGQLVDYVRDISGLNLHIDGKNIPDPTADTFTIKLKNLSIAGAFDLMLPSKGKAYMVEDGVVLITTSEAVRRRVHLELYDVQDLTFSLKDFPGVNMSLTDEGGIMGMATEEGAQQTFGGEQLAELIRNTIDKNNWDEAVGQSITFQNGLLIIRNANETHRKIRRFLSDLRASTGIMVSVETRFLTVENEFLQQVGMDFRDVDGARVQGVLTLDDISPTFATVPGSAFTQFIDPDGGGGPLSGVSPGITGTFGRSVVRNMGARIQNIMVNDQVLQRFYQTSLSPMGGASLQYTLLDDISFEAIIRLVSRSTRSNQLVAPKLTLFNTQRGNILIANQFAYIRDYDIQVATATTAVDPIPGIVNDGVSLDVRPIVSADRRYITMELRPTIATMVPPPPNIFGVDVSFAMIGAFITSPLVYRIETPALAVQGFRTTVVIPDRGTLLLGGMSTYFEEDAQSSIPLWHNIPILGNLGSEKVKGLQRRHFMTLLRARIIIPDEAEKRKFD
ncbi:MAG: tetratricopeptide repeat protein [Planctomycetes bacterium]|nr:tetratricopeptide repeat protein [Planctomycetota bacterium]